MPPDFPDLPDDVQPHLTRILTTTKGNLTFAGEYAYLSNMFRCSFKLDGVQYTSGEQCTQFTKARFLNKEHAAQRILSTNDPFECKRLGDELERTPAWTQVQETKILEIQRAKFEQNSDLKQRLIETGNVKLIEATVGKFWGINGSIHSKAALDESGNGKNKFGQILMALRLEYDPSTAPPAPTPTSTPTPTPATSTVTDA